MSEHDPTPYEVTLTAAEIATAIQFAKDHWALVNERVTRYATPDEREAVAARIDPDTAWFFFQYAEILDPYGEFDLLEEEHCVGRCYFAIDPDEGVAVEQRDWTPELKHAFEARGRGEPQVTEWPGLDRPPPTEPT